MEMGRDSHGGYSKITQNNGTVLTPDVLDGSVTLVAGTYYVALGSPYAPLSGQTSVTSMHFKWAAAVAGTITFEDSNFPMRQTGVWTGGGTVADIDETAGNWIPETSATSAMVTGASNTASGLTVTMGGAAAGGAMYHVGNLGSRRARFKLVVTVGGKAWIAPHGKA